MAVWLMNLPDLFEISAVECSPLNQQFIDRFLTTRPARLVQWEEENFSKHNQSFQLQLKCLFRFTVCCTKLFILFERLRSFCSRWWSHYSLAAEIYRASDLWVRGRQCWLIKHDHDRFILERASQCFRTISHKFQSIQHVVRSLVSDRID